MLHTDSMILNSGLCAALMALVFISMRQIPGMAREGLSWWGLATALFAVASISLFMHTIWDMGPSVALSSTLFIGGMAALVIGTREFFGAPRRLYLIGSIAALTTVGVLYFTLVDGQATLRNALVSGFITIAMLDLARLCLPHARLRVMRFPALLLGGVTLLGAVIHALRATLAGWMAAGGMPWVEPEFPMQAVRLYNAFAMTALAVGFLMVAHARLRAALDRQITHDPLTGVLSRAGFKRACEAHFRRADRQGRPLCLAFIDLDHFKTINDVYGHPGGDRVLEHFAATASRMIGHEHAFGRLGGEEFALLYCNTALEDARLQSYRLRAEIERQGCPSDEHWIMYTVSIGLVQRHAGESLAALLKRADTALYAAKAAGRNTVSIGRSSTDTSPTIDVVPPHAIDGVGNA
jgi:diguanylate cyclase (GGDEF)-like protein